MLFDPQKWVMPEIPEVEPENEPWRKLLLDAANLIEKRGWCRHHAQSHGRYCAIGAMSKMAGVRPGAYDACAAVPGIVHQAEDKVLAYLKQNGQQHFSIPSWNDDQTRGKVVIETLRKVAKS